MVRQAERRHTRPPAARGRGRRPPPHQLVLRWLAVLVALGALSLVALRMLRSGSLPGITLAGADVGALDREALTERVEHIAAEREAQRLEVRRAATAAEPGAVRSYPRSDLGYEVEVEETAGLILERGRQANPFAALADQVMAVFSTIEMDPVVSFEESRLAAWVERVRNDLATDATEGGLEIEGTTVEAVLPQPGVTINRRELRKLAEEAVLDDEGSLTAPVEELESSMTVQEVRRAKRRAEEILSAPITLEHSGRETRLRPRQIAAALSATNVEENGSARIVLSINPKRLAERTSGSLSRFNRTPEDARFELRNERVRVIAGRPGLAVDTKKLASSLIRIATSDDRSASVPLEKVKPAFSTQDAKDLNIVERVSSFTTYHSCCEPRVENIHRIADMIDGTVVEPGEQFSINGAVGQRTREKGFVGAPAILNGEYVEEVGGGISQFATTIFNATFFGGYDFLEYKAHSYYISRYPMGREATVSWPAPDFRFLNDSNSGIYIDTGYSDTSITITYYGRKERSVRSVSGKPHNYKSPPTRCEENKSLRREEKRVAQSGSRGFDITVERVFGSGDREPLHTTYLPVPKIVEKRKC